MKRFAWGLLATLPAVLLLCAVAILQAKTSKGKKFALLVGVKDYRRVCVSHYATS